MIFGCAVQAAAAGQGASPSARAVEDGYTFYSTAAADGENYVELEFSGNTLTLRRRAYTAPLLPDQIMIRLESATLFDLQIGWIDAPIEDMYFGYDKPLDLSDLPNGSYTLEVVSRSAYRTPITSIEFIRSAEGFFFPKRDTLSKRHNYELLRRLEGGAAPDDFAELVRLYGAGDNAPTLARIKAMAESLTAGCESETQKVQAIYHWITKNIAYDNDANGGELYSRIEANPAEKARLDDPLHAFTQKYALCYGFARLTTLMMGYAGIPCVYIRGRVTGDRSEDINKELGTPKILEESNHAWNAVKLDGSWRFIDTSKDATGNYWRRDSSRAETGYIETARDPLCLHMMISLSEISKTHIGLWLGARGYGSRLTAAAIPDGWQNAGAGRAYYIDGEKARSLWVTVSGETYYFSGSGVPQQGWRMVDGYWRYFSDQGILATGRHELPNGTEKAVYIFDGDGCLTADDDWVSFNGQLHYYKGKEMLRGWQHFDGDWRYFSDEGALYRDAENPLRLDGGSYSVDEDGVLQVSGAKWVTLGKERVYYEDSRPLTGLCEIAGKQYLLDSRGVMQTGWLNIGGKAFYFEDSGAMRTGWLYLDQEWYYCDPQKGRLTGLQKVGANSYYFTEVGALSTGGWVNLGSTKLYYEGATTKNRVPMGGKPAHGWRMIDKKLYFFDRGDGRMHIGPKEMFNENNNTWYVINKDGTAIKR
jgi:glucan-binding YG repeat protein